MYVLYSHLLNSVMEKVYSLTGKMFRILFLFTFLYIFYGVVFGLFPYKLTVVEKKLESKRSLDFSFHYFIPLKSL